MQLCEIWRAALELDVVHVDDDFFELGGDSLRALRIITEVEKLLGVDLSVADFLTSSTVAAVARLLRDGEGGTARGPLVRFQEGDGRPPLYLFHPLSGTILHYAAFARAIGPEQPIWGLQSIGLDPGDAPLPSLEAMAQAYLLRMRDVHPGGPWQLAGYSMGGLIAFEVARQLSSSGEEVGFLGLFDTLAPSNDSAPPLETMRERGLRNVSRDVLRIEIDIDWLMSLPRDRQIQVLLERGVAAGTLPADYDSEHVRRLLDIRIHNRVATAAYIPQPFSGTVTFFSASTQKQAEQNGERYGGWEDLAERVIVYQIAGDHFSIMEPGSVRQIALLTRNCLQPGQTEAHRRRD
jgi:thioesterase domain-containing protein/acyl carrier protein